MNGYALLDSITIAGPWLIVRVSQAAPPGKPLRSADMCVAMHLFLQALEQALNAATMTSGSRPLTAATLPRSTSAWPCSFPGELAHHSFRLIAFSNHRTRFYGITLMA